MADVVIDLRDRRPVWAIPPWAMDEIRGAFPPSWTVHDETGGGADGSGDGGGALSPALLEALRGATVYLGFGVPPAVLEAGEPTLRWVHSGAAGVGSALHPRMMGSSVLFSNSAGIHGPPMAETVVGMLLHFVRGFDFAVAAQRDHRWGSRAFYHAETPVRELQGLRVGILGYGGVGREVAARLCGFGCAVTGLGRTPPVSPIDALGVRCLDPTAPGALTELLTQSEALVVTAPETPETRGLLDAAALRTLPRGAILVNVARGGLVDEAALVEALRDGHLRGAGLDVFAVEPLPETSPLWALPNVLLTPHVSAVTRGYWRRETDLIVENARRFLAGETLRNLVDRAAGY
jgi:phosphoglycerate dehydrogenase-like enzyme